MTNTPIYRYDSGTRSFSLHLFYRSTLWVISDITHPASYPMKVSSMARHTKSADPINWKTQFNFKYHLLVAAMTCFVWSAIVPILTISISSFPMVEAFSFKLSRLLYDEDDLNDVRERPVFKRRDLREEFGEQAFECLVDSALGLTVDVYGEEGVCLSHFPEDGARSIDNTGGGIESPSASPTSRPVRNLYGVDVSFPIHYSDLDQFPRESGDDTQSNIEASIPLHGRKEMYNKFMKNCRTFYQTNSPSKSSRSISQNSVCDESETDRFDMNLNQPPVMQNYTTLGFQKTKAPRHLMQQLTQFWIDNSKIIVDDVPDEAGEEISRIKHGMKPESWYPGDTHTNHWEAPTYMLSVDDVHLNGGGIALKQRIWKAVESTLLQWIQTEADINVKGGGRATKLKLNPASLYGIRMYTKGAVLSPHVDRLPLVTSAIINVAQDVEEPWPMEIIGHDGVAYNVTLEPGDMLLYESHSAVHGRPFPLKGNYYANIFVHFEPDNHCVRHADRMKGIEIEEDAEEMFKRAQRKQNTLKKSEKWRDDTMKNTGRQQLSATDLPFFIQPNSVESRRWKQEIRYKQNPKEFEQAPPPNFANTLAAAGNLIALKRLGSADVALLFAEDSNGWQPIHEAARGGKTDVLKYLIAKGADVNRRTNFGKGPTPGWWAEETNGADHPSVKVLREAGGKKLGAI